MGALSLNAEANFGLKTLNVKRVCVVLVLISSVSADKTAVCIFNHLVASCIAEIVLLQVVEEDVFSDIFDSLDIATFVNAQIREKVL